MNEHKKQISELTSLNEELENYFRNTIIPQLFVDGDLNLRKFTPPAMKQFNLTDSDIGRPINNGIGIENENLDRIFTKYQRVENLTEGNGLGLYLIKEIVNRSGGQIFVESEFGSGTTFKILLKKKSQ